jgi:hypothetical protein
MEIQLPESQSYFENIKERFYYRNTAAQNGREMGEVLAAFSHAGDNCVINLKVLSSKSVPLQNIESRLDTEKQR